MPAGAGRGRACHARKAWSSWARMRSTTRIRPRRRAWFADASACKSSTLYARTRRGAEWPRSSKLRGTAMSTSIRAGPGASAARSASARSSGWGAEVHANVT
jgi:hypothetical protein